MINHYMNFLLLLHNSTYIVYIKEKIQLSGCSTESLRKNKCAKIL